MTEHPCLFYPLFRSFTDPKGWRLNVGSVQMLYRPEKYPCL